MACFASEIAQQVNYLAGKPGDLISISETQLRWKG